MSVRPLLAKRLNDLTIDIDQSLTSNELQEVILRDVNLIFGKIEANEGSTFNDGFDKSDYEY